jgi:hypothetical protein
VGLVAPFRQALKEMGIVDGRNVVIEYRWRPINRTKWRHLRRSWSAGRQA